MALKIKPLTRQPRMTQTQLCRAVHRATERICGVAQQHIRIATKKKNP